MNNPPAFPHTVEYRGSDCGGIIPHGGMTLRDYFAAKAMQAMLTSPEFLVVVTADEAVGGNAKERVSNVAFAYADAMLEARKK